MSGRNKQNRLQKTEYSTKNEKVSKYLFMTNLYKTNRPRNGSENLPNNKGLKISAGEPNVCCKGGSYLY